MKRLMLFGAMLAALAWTGRAAAHEGHAHKVMGTVAVIDASHVEVDTKDGKKESYPLTPETKYLKGKVAAALADVKVGARVVLSVVEKDRKTTVTELVMGATEKHEGAHGHNH